MDLSMRVAWIAGLVLIASSAMAQMPRVMTDLECRSQLTDALNNMHLVDPLDPMVYSYVVRVDTAERIGTNTTNYISVLRLFDNATTTGELAKAELTTYRGVNLMQRVVADGRRVWAYDPTRNEYSVSQYDTERNPRNADYRKDFVNSLREPVQGVPSNLINLALQSGLGGNVGSRDWLPGFAFQGEESVAGDTQTIWQALPDNTRFARFDLIRDTNGLWQLDTARIFKRETVGTQVRELDTIISFPRDAFGNRLTQTANSVEFSFRPPARARVLSSPRPIKF
jgi:hypothetical protein